MSSYKVMPRRRDSGFKVEVITVDGVRHTLLGFETELEAVIWAEADKERERAWEFSNAALVQIHPEPAGDAIAQVNPGARHAIHGKVGTLFHPTF